jgi:hypothetical protein
MTGNSNGGLETGSTFTSALPQNSDGDSFVSEVADFNVHNSDAARRTAELEMAMATEKPKVVLSQERCVR